jgi:hypothetical protein
MKARRRFLTCRPRHCAIDFESPAFNAPSTEVAHLLSIPSFSSLSDIILVHHQGRRGSNKRFFLQGTWSIKRRVSTKFKRPSVDLLAFKSRRNGFGP